MKLFASIHQKEFIGIFCNYIFPGSVLLLPVFPIDNFFFKFISETVKDIGNPSTYSTESSQNYHFKKNTSKLDE